MTRLGGVFPVMCPSGESGALHMILVARKRSHPATIAYIERRLQEGKTRREANRCLKRYLARSLYRK
jgi:transposase